MHESRHEDNPVIWDADRGEWTAVGAQYIAKLDALTGVRFHRLRHGRWVGSEGMVYGDWDRNLHLIDRFPIPDSWRRVRSVDFGYTNPFVCQWWAIDGDGRMFLYREIYRTKRTVADHAVPIKVKSEGERIEVTVSDHDAEDRATLHQCGILTMPAHKAITPGIQAVEERLRVAGDGRARLFVFRDALVSRDEELTDAKLPTSTAEEFDAYIWPRGQDGKALKEIPVDANNHGMDAMRYAVAYLDLVSRPGPSASAPRVAPVMPAMRQAMPRYGMPMNMGGRR
jgi:phage terminase large subunit